MPVNEAVIAEFYLYNLYMPKFFKKSILVAMDRCVNCKVITDGIHVIKHK